MKGLCNCGKELEEAAFKTCITCRAKKAERDRKRKQSNVIRGYCRCGGKLEKEKTFKQCLTCRESQKKRRAGHKMDQAENKDQRENAAIKPPEYPPGEMSRELPPQDDIGAVRPEKDESGNAQDTRPPTTTNTEQSENIPD